MPDVEIQSAHGTKLLIESATPGTFVEIGGVGDITGPDVQRPEIAKITHDKDYEQKTLGVKQFGQVGAPIEWDGVDPGQVLLAAAFASKAKTNFQIQYPDANQSQDAFEARVSGLGRGAPVQGTLMRQATLSLTTDVTEGTWT